MNSNICKGQSHDISAHGRQRNLRLTAIAHTFGLGIASVALLTLGGCGSGDSPTSPVAATPNPPATSSALTGKAIDGYLVGALVCLDQNHNNSCDAGEPSTATDAQGNYRLPDAGSQLGQTILVTVTPQTKDLSRPGYVFPASFTLSQIVTESGQQHISPLSTLVSAQMQTGLSQAQATAAVTAPPKDAPVSDAQELIAVPARTLRIRRITALIALGADASP